MEDLSRYWQICQISLVRTRFGYEYRSLPVAQAFFQSRFSNSSIAQTSIQTTLLSHFHSQKSDVDSGVDSVTRAQAGLCLRCYLSEPILKACKKLASLFSSSESLSYRDLLPFVLNDDGKALVILDSDRKTHLILDEQGNCRPTAFKIFAVEILKTYKLNSEFSMSLDNWVFLQTKQHPELKAFLSEFGFQHLSDWALLNRVRSKQIEQLSERDRCLVEVFHAIYRRDRRQQQQVSRCVDPSDRQLVEMATLLQRQGISLQSSELIKALRQAAKQLRQFDIWQSREPLEVLNQETGGYDLRVDLPADSASELEPEEREFLEFLHQQLDVVLKQSIATAIQNQIASLKKSKRYAPFASRYIPGLQLYYSAGLSLREISSQIGMSSWDQTRRILNPGELLSSVRRSTVQQLLEPILKKAQSQGFAANPPDANDLRTLTEHIEAFVDAEIFEEAVSEIKAGKNRSLDSRYAQQLKSYVEHQIEHQIEQQV